MSNDPKPDGPISDPQPMTSEELARFTRNEEARDKTEAEWNGARGVGGIMRTIPIVIGGVVTFGFMASLFVTTTSGATRSAKVRWQLRQDEIQKAIAASSPIETNAPAATAVVVSPNPSMR
jgi:hypothetical protein